MFIPNSALQVKDMQAQITALHVNIKMLNNKTQLTHAMFNTKPVSSLVTSDMKKTFCILLGCFHLRFTPSHESK